MALTVKSRDRRGTIWPNPRAATLRRAIERQAEVLPLATSPAIGVDVVSITTWRQRLETGGPALLKRIYTERELRDAGGRLERLATRLAAKEAVLKALGTGYKGLGFKCVEVRIERDGKPTIHLEGPAADRAGELGLGGVAISMCHEDGYAIAIAVGIANRGSGTNAQAHRDR